MKIVLFLILLLAALFLAGCSGRDATLDATFLPGGSLLVKVSDKTHDVRVFDSRQNLVARVPVFENKDVEIRFPWETGKVYTVRFDGKKAGSVTAPAFRPQYRLRIHAPVGQKTSDFYLSEERKLLPDTTLVIAMNAMEKVDLLFEVEKLCDTAAGRVAIHVNPVTPDTSGVFLDPRSIHDSSLLEFEFDKRFWSMQASITDTPIATTTAFTATLTADAWRQSFNVAFARQAANADSINIVSWALPTDQSGLSSSRHAAGTILMPNALWDRLGSWFGVKAEIVNFFRPFTFQTVRIANFGAEPVGLMLTGEVIDLSTNEESSWFKAPDNQFTGGTDKIVSFVTIAPGQTEACVLPIYMAYNTPAGAYKSRITVQRLGSDYILRRIENTVSVVRSNVLFTAWTLGIALLSLGWLIAVIVFYKRIVDSIGLRILVLLSLLGSLQFCLSFMGRIVSSAMYAILGPFNCLVGGLLTEVLTYLLVTSILFLVPRVGAMTLAGIVSYIMGGILFGSFGLTDILFLGSGIAFREILLFGFGVTRFKQPAAQPAIVPMMLALGIADAASTFTSLTLHAVFYRLYFADWYILLNVVVTGFLYTVIGVSLGKPLGQSLRKVHL
jgi:hypothetical protein